MLKAEVVKMGNKRGGRRGIERRVTKEKGEEEERAGNEEKGRRG